MIALNLPMPPSVNKMTRNAPGIGRLKTKAYRSWIKEAGQEVNVQLIGKRHGLPFAGDVGVVMTVERRGDLDNRVKATLDLLTIHQIYRDDDQVADLHVGFGPVKGIHIEICEINEVRHEKV